MPELWSEDEFDTEDPSVTVALVGAPAAPHRLVQPRHLMRLLALLSASCPRANAWWPCTPTRTAPRPRCTAGSNLEYP
jgi:hypothetical protein